ncbi:MAG: L-lactate MFS transporter [Bacillota bacterium]
MTKMIKTNKGRQVVIAAALINFMTGMMYAWSIISKALVESHGWSSKEASLPYTVFTVAFPLAMVVFGKFQDAKGPRISGLLGSILVGSGFILSGLMLNPLIMLLTIGVMAGAGVGIITISTAPPAIKWFHPSMKGKITGIVVAGVGLSAVLYSPLGAFLVGAVGVARTLVYIGILVLSTTLFLAWRLENPPEGYDFDGFKAKPDYIYSRDIEWREMLRTSEFYKLWLMLGLSSSAGLMVISHISSIAKIQAGWQAGFVLVMVISVFNSSGRIIGGVLSDRMGRINTMRVLFLIQASNMILFRNANAIPVMLVAAAVAGLCYGAGFSVFPAAVGDYYGTKHFGFNYGLLFSGWGLGGIIGPMTGAAIYDSTGAYGPAFLVSFGLLIVSFLITLTFKKYVPGQ